MIKLSDKSNFSANAHTHFSYLDVFILSVSLISFVDFYSNWFPIRILTGERRGRYQLDADEEVT